eukprot:m.141291 g.141291  ORF g.141291 m.141291 type:complete len:255 (+) comp13194_c4_seq2:181-945(+)
MSITSERMTLNDDVDNFEMTVESIGLGNSDKKTKKKKKGKQQQRQHSATRNNCPQNSKIFKSTRLPNGGHVSYFAVPGSDDDHKQKYKSFDEMASSSLQSTQRSSFGQIKKGNNNTRRYGCNEQPWALPTIAQKDLGLSTHSYEESLHRRTKFVRRTRTAPAMVGIRGGRELEEDVAMITSSDPIATGAIMAYFAESSRLDQTVLAQFMKKVSLEIQNARQSADDSAFVPSRPGTQQRRGVSSTDSGKKPSWKF